MDCNTSGFPVPHHLLEFAKVHVHCVGDAIQSSHALTFSSPSALDLSQHQGLFQWVICLHQMANILELQLQPQSFQWIFSVDLPEDWLVWSTCCPRGSQESSQAPQFEGIKSFMFCLPSGPALTAIPDHWDIALTIRTLVSRVMFLLFNTLFMFAISFLSRINPLLISWLQSLFTMILEPKKRKFVIASIFSLSIFCEVMGLDAMIFRISRRPGWVSTLHYILFLSTVSYLSETWYVMVVLIKKTTKIWKLISNNKWEW